MELKDVIETPYTIKLGWGAAAQLILGYRDAREVVTSVGARDDLKMIESIFPKSTPYIWQADRF
jgi:hypothetical protein